MADGKFEVKVQADVLINKLTRDVNKALLYVSQQKATTCVEKEKLMFSFNAEASVELAKIVESLKLIEGQSPVPAAHSLSAGGSSGEQRSSNPGRYRVPGPSIYRFSPQKSVSALFQGSSMKDAKIGYHLAMPVIVNLASRTDVILLPEDKNLEGWLLVTEWLKANGLRRPPQNETQLHGCIERAIYTRAELYGESSFFPGGIHTNSRYTFNREGGIEESLWGYPKSDFTHRTDRITGKDVILSDAAGLMLGFDRYAQRGISPAKKTEETKAKEASLKPTVWAERAAVAETEKEKVKTEVAEAKSALPSITAASS